MQPRIENPRHCAACGDAFVCTDSIESSLLRNCSLDDLTGRKVDKPETEIGRALS